MQPIVPWSAARARRLAALQSRFVELLAVAREAGHLVQARLDEDASIRNTCRPLQAEADRPTGTPGRRAAAPGAARRPQAKPSHPIFDRGKPAAQMELKMTVTRQGRKHGEPIPLHPLSLEDALRGAAATGPVTDDSPEGPAEQVRAATRKSVKAARQKKSRDGEPAAES